MVARLKSISRRIHWSLVLRAAIFALAWVWLPFWLFLLIALYLYFCRGSSTGTLAVPFLILLILCLIQPPELLFAAIFGAIFYIILLIKGLLLINRRSAYELLVLTLSFLLLRDFYLAFNGGVSGAAFFGAILLAVALALLLRCLTNADRDVARVVSWLSFLLFIQILFAGLFLPVDFIYQSVLVFLAVVLIIDLVPEAVSGGLARNKILATGMTVFALFTVVLASARWGL